jgi:hypothetical protein
MTVKLILKSETTTVDLEEIGFKITQFDAEDGKGNSLLYFSSLGLNDDELGVALDYLKFQLHEMSKTPSVLVCVGLDAGDLQFPLTYYSLEKKPSVDNVRYFTLTLTHPEPEQANPPLDLTRGDIQC